MCGFEGLLKLLERGEKANRLADVLACGSERCEGVEDIDVNLAGICLAGDDVGRSEACFLGDELVKLLDLVVVAFKDLEEGCLDGC